MIANIMGNLVRIEHQQKLERIQSGILSAEWAGNVLSLISITSINDLIDITDLRYP